MESELSRQTATQEVTAKGSGRPSRLDPAQMPHRFAARGEPLRTGAEAPSVDVYIDRDMVIVKRRLAGLPLTLVQPVSMFLGVFAEVLPGALPGGLKVRIGLKHRDPALSIELATSDSIEGVADDWCAWGRALSLPLLMVEPDGSCQDLGAATGDLAGRAPLPRRRVAALTGHRPRFLVRRKPGSGANLLRVHRGEREIIART
ncbi:hypothetical protein GCM10007285_19220 [Stappia taiwanensis]|nr:hypothetical protein GCM10007285_19220 [Stappia taiwanensis]